VSRLLALNSFFVSSLLSISPIPPATKAAAALALKNRISFAPPGPSFYHYYCLINRQREDKQPMVSSTSCFISKLLLLVMVMGITTITVAAATEEGLQGVS